MAASLWRYIVLMYSLPAGPWHSQLSSQDALQGSIPDMTATTALYLQLQRIYREQADADFKAVAQHVRKVLQLVGRDQHAISHTDIKTFCKHARYLR